MNHTLRGIAVRPLRTTAQVLLAITATSPFHTASAQSITAVSWGGSFGRAVHEGVNIPFMEATGIRVRVEDYNGGLAQIRAQVEVGNIHWDVVDLEIADAVRGCDEGLLEPIDFRSLPPGPDGTPAEEDFVEEGQTECGVGQIRASTVYAYNADNLRGVRPTTMADFFDLETFPGMRVVGIVAGTPRMQEAKRYLAFATSAESQVRIARRISYSPARRSGARLVTTHVTAGVEMAPHMPASADNAKRALRYDWIWWADRQDELNERFSAWLAR